MVLAKKLVVLFAIFLSACSMIYKPIQAGITCKDTLGVLLFSGGDADAVMSFLCQGTCLDKNKKYSGTYDCDKNNGTVICYCK